MGVCVCAFCPIVATTTYADIYAWKNPMEIFSFVRTNELRILLLLFDSPPVRVYAFHARKSTEAISVTAVNNNNNNTKMRAAYNAFRWFIGIFLLLLLWLDWLRVYLVKIWMWIGVAICILVRELTLFPLPCDTSGIDVFGRFILTFVSRAAHHTLNRRQQYIARYKSVLIRKSSTTVTMTTVTSIQNQSNLMQIVGRWFCCCELTCWDRIFILRIIFFFISVTFRWRKVPKQEIVFVSMRISKSFQLQLFFLLLSFSVFISSFWNEQLTLFLAPKQICVKRQKKNTHFWPRETISVFAAVVRTFSPLQMYFTVLHTGSVRVCEVLPCCRTHCCVSLV